MKNYKVSKGLAIFVAIAGAIVMLGWIFDIGFLKNISPGQITMKFSTAFSFLLSGITLYFIAKVQRNSSDFGLIVILITVMIVLLMMVPALVSSFFGVRLGIEALFVKDVNGAVGGWFPGMPSVLTMINFILIASAGILTTLNLANLKTQLFCIGWIILVIGGVAAAGYLFNLPLLRYDIKGWSNPMAIHTSILFVLSGLSLIFLRKQKVSSRRANMPIRQRLIILFLSIAIIPILFIGSLNFLNAKDELLTEKTEKLSVIADLKVDKIKNYFDNLKGEMRLAQDYAYIKTNLPIVTKYSQDRTNPEYIKAKEMLKERLRALLNVRKEVVDFMLVSSEGKVVYAANDRHAEDLDSPLRDPENKVFEEGKKGIYLSNIFKSSTPYVGYNHGMMISAPIYDFENRFAGVIVFEIDMNPIYSFIQDTTGLGQTGETLVVQKKISQQGMPNYKGKDGEYALFLNSLRHDPEAALKKIIFMGEKEAMPAQRAVKGEEGSGSAIDYRNKEVLAVWRYISFLNWGLVAKMDMQEILAPVNALRLLTIIICIIVGAIVVIIALVILSLVSDPIHMLHKGTEIIGSGNLDYKVGTDAKDEIGQLSRAFDEMTSKLKARAEETKAVNQQLRASNQQLRATEQQLRAGEQQLRAANQQLRANEQQLRAEITERKKAEIELRDSEHGKAVVLDNTSEIIAYHDRDHNIQWANKAYLKATGLSLSEIKGKKCYHAWGLDRPCNNCPVTNVLETGEPHEVELTPQNQEHWPSDQGSWLSRAAPVKDDTGNIIGAIEVAYDITERKKMDERLLAAAEEWRTTFDSISDMVSIIDKDYKIIRVNKSFVDRFKMKPQEIIGKNYYELVRGTHEPPPECPHKGTLETKMPQHSEYFEPHLDMYLEVTTSPVLDEKGELFASVHIARDITLRKKLEKSQRLAELGKLVADMAHEVNNPLMIISGNAQLPLFDGTLNEEIKNNFKIIHEEANRAKDIIQRLLKFSRPTKGERKETDINQSVESVTKLLEHQFSLSNVKIKKDLKYDLPAIVIDEKQMQEVFMNLLNNARDAMPDGGIIVINTSLEQDSIRIDVKDSGIGMDEETLFKIFEPFFTMKEKGTGLGLSVCYGIIKGHNGELKFESQPGKGTIATVLIPIRGG